jgi:hypothetical protein
MIISAATKLWLIKRAVYNKETSCLEWFHALNTNGYPQFSIKRITRLVHRELLKRKLNQELDLSKQATHKCNNRRCISTASKHVVLGNNRLNQLDSVMAGTHWMTGRRKRSCKITGMVS